MVSFSTPRKGKNGRSKELKRLLSSGHYEKGVRGPEERLVGQRVIGLNADNINKVIR